MYKSRLAILNAMFLAFAPIGRVYETFHATTLSGALTFLLFILNFKYLYNYTTLRAKELRIILVLMLIGFLSSVVNILTFDYSLFLHNLYPLFIFTSGLVLSANMNMDIFKRSLVILGLIATAICFLQMYQMLTQGYFENFYIPGLKVFRENSEVILRLRPYSIFSEPAHLSIYLLPVFYYTFINKYYILASIFALGILCSGSTTGFLLLGVVFAVSSGISYKNIIVYAIGAVLVLYTLNQVSGDILTNNIEKLGKSDSNDIRMLGALEYTKYFTVGNWFLGTGFNQVDNFLKAHGVSNYLGETFVTGNYAAAIIYVLICYGVIGEMAFLKYLITLFKKNKENIGFFIIFLGVLCSDQVLYNDNLLYLWVLVLVSTSMKDEYKPFKFFM